MTLKECRKKRGLSQTELALRVGLNQTTISQYENGSRKPKLSMAKKIAEVLGISLDAFVCLSTFIDPAMPATVNKTKNTIGEKFSNKQISLFEDEELEVLTKEGI